MNNKGWVIIALVVAGLYWLQAVLIPLALAILLTFLLSPVVGTLQRRGLGQVAAVLVTVFLGLSALGATGWTLTRQLVTLADELPRYTLNINRTESRTFAGSARAVPWRRFRRLWRTSSARSRRRTRWV
jgi:predicted PurR-regulated permease PerM